MHAIARVMYQYGLVWSAKKRTVAHADVETLEGVLDAKAKQMLKIANYVYCFEKLICLCDV